MPVKRGAANAAYLSCRCSRLYLLALLFFGCLSFLSWSQRSGSFSTRQGLKDLPDGRQEARFGTGLLGEQSDGQLAAETLNEGGEESRLSWNLGNGNQQASSWLVERKAESARANVGHENLHQLASEGIATDSVRSEVTALTNAGQVMTRQIRQHRQEERLRYLLENTHGYSNQSTLQGIGGKHSIWRPENENADSLVRLMRDQLIMARVYATIAQAHQDPNLVRELKLRMKESQRILGESSVDVELLPGANERVKLMGQVLSKARDRHNDCTPIVKKLRAMVQLAEEQGRNLKKQNTFLNQLAAKTIPKGLHCLSMQLTVDYYQLPPSSQEFPHKERLEDTSLYHYALFSDNILAVSVVVNSTVSNAEDPEKHVFHLVTDKLNYGAMRMWFLANPPGKATISVENVDDFKWLNSTYCPVLRQLESAAMKEYYFKSEPTTLAAGSSNLKYRNPKYLSMLNHLRFYLPEVYPKLDKIVFLDDDIVVQQDLTALWSVDLNGNVNGAVETCGVSFHRFDKYLNFSNPLIARNFDPNACGWAYGMNVFDLEEWKKRDITGIYHRWQNLNEDRLLWKLGTLPPGLITFYNLTQPLDKFWHVLGLGYNPSIDKEEVEAAAVVHYNGNYKPWLEIGMSKYKSYWTKYVRFDHPVLQQCNINE